MACEHEAEPVDPAVEIAQDRATSFTGADTKDLRHVRRFLRKAGSYIDFSFAR